jgi:hypothetical protein
MDQVLWGVFLDPEIASDQGVIVQNPAISDPL